MTTIQRRHRNKVVKLKKPDGEWFDDFDVIADNFKSFYSELFSHSGPRNYDDLLGYVQELVDDNDFILLSAPISCEEIKSASFELGSLKAPSPNVYSGLFYHHAWSIVGKQVCNMV